MRADKAKAGHLVYVGRNKAVKVKATKHSRGVTLLHLQPDTGKALWVALPAGAELMTRWRSR